MKQLKNRNKFNTCHIVKTIRCDDAGENKKLKELSDIEGLGITYEFTGPGSPQFNGRVERKFATLFARVRSMLNGAKLPMTIRKRLWAEAAKTATNIENILVSYNKPKSSFNVFYMTDEVSPRPLKPFGDIAIVEYNKTRKIRAKLADRGRACVYLGIADDHSAQVHRFLNLDTNHIVLSRDVIWLNKSYGDWKGLTVNHVVQTNNNQFNNEDSEEEYIHWMKDNNININEQTENEQDKEEEDTNVKSENSQESSESSEESIQPIIPNARLMGEMRNLGTFYNEEANKKIEELLTDQGRETSDEESANVLLDRKSIDMKYKNDTAMLVVGDSDINYNDIHPSQYKDIFDIPRNFDEAWNHKNVWLRTKWRKAITTEVDKMKQHKVMRLVKRNKMEPGRKCIKYKWILDIKRDGTFKARLVACGYSQVPGIDFKESYSPVINDVVFRIILIFQIVFSLDSVLLDVEVAFLNGELNEIIYMECPQGIEHDDDEVVLLERSMYGLVQATRQFFIKYSNILKKIGFKQSVAEPCLFFKEVDDSIILIAIHVDDCYVVGKINSIKKVIEDIEKEGLKIKATYDTKDYLSCEIIFNQDKTRGWIGQPHLVKKLEKTYADIIANKKVSFLTPGTPHYNIVRPSEDENKLSKEDQTMYRSAVGTLLQFVKHSRPDIANPVRELSKCMDCATPAALKELKRLIRFVH